MIMHRVAKAWTLLLLTVALWIMASSLQASAEKSSKPWVMGYLPAYEQSGSGSFDFMDKDDWKMLTHAAHFSAHVNADGTLDFNAEKMSEANRTAAIQAAHQRHVPLVLSVLAWYDVYEPVIKNASTRKTLINQILEVLKEGYDGVDLDLEPIRAEQAGAEYQTFVNELHTALQTLNKTNNPKMLVERPLLTLTTGVENVADDSPGQLRTLLASIQDKVDQINVMGYDLSSLSDEVIWHDGALHDGGQKYPAYVARSVVSVSRSLQQFMDGGVSPSKLGLGISLEVRIWQGGKVKGTGEGVTAPMQEWSIAPKSWNTGTPRASVAQLLDPDYTCMTTPAGEAAAYKCGYSPDYYRWDDKAKAAYLSINNPGSDYDAFISYTDERAAQEKVKFSKEKGLGGIMIWQMRHDYRADQPEGKKRPIIKALRDALNSETGK